MIEYADELHIDRYLNGRKKRCSRQRKWPKALVNFGPCDCCTGGVVPYGNICTTCCSLSFASTMTMVIHDTTGLCPCFNGTYSLVYNPTLAAPSNPSIVGIWTGTVTGCSGTNVIFYWYCNSVAAGGDGTFVLQYLDPTDEIVTGAGCQDGNSGTAGCGGGVVGCNQCGTCPPNGQTYHYNFDLRSTVPGCPAFTQVSVTISNPAGYTPVICTSCCPNALPTTLTLEIYGCIGSCACWNGTYTLQFNPASIGTGSPNWQSTTGACGGTLNILLTCVNEFGIGFTVDGIASPSGNQIGFVLTGTCSPFFMTGTPSGVSVCPDGSAGNGDCIVTQ